MAASQSARGGRGGKKTSVPSRIPRSVLEKSSLTKTYRNPSRILTDEGTLSQRGFKAAKRKGRTK